jgi:hypothetical protein
MRNFVLVLCFLVCGYATAYATEVNSGVNCGSNPETSYQSSKTRSGSNDHKHCYNDNDTHAKNNREDPAGVGIDLLIHETDNYDFLAEYKRDFNNNENSIFGVIKTKKSLVELIKSFFNKGE